MATTSAAGTPRPNRDDPKEVSIRSKVLYVMGLTTIGLIVVIFMASHFIFQYGVEVSEERYCRQNTERALTALRDSLESLDTQMNDWSTWDDSYEFVQTGDPSYVESNLLDESFVRLSTDAMIFVNSRHEIVYAKAVDLKSGEEIPVSQYLLDQASAEDSCLEPADESAAVSGIMTPPEGPALVASRPILTSDGEGPMQGYLIWIRYLDSREIGRLGEMTRLSLTVRSVDSPDLPVDFLGPKSELQNQGQIAIQRRSSDAIAGYMQLEDIHGQPGVLLRAEMTRDAFKRLRADTAAFMWLFIIAGGVFCVVSIHLLGKLVLTRLMRLSKNVIGIAESSDLSARLPEDGNDELTHLAEAINGMLESLEHSEMERQENAEQLETLIENQGEGVLIVDIDGSIIFANPAAAQIFGTPRTGLLGVKINDFVTPADLAVINAQREKCRSGQKARCEIEVLRGPMDRRAVLVTASPRLDDDGNFIGTFKVVRDITDIRVAESLKATVDAKNDFLSMVSHELRTPLVPIISYADLLLDGTFGQLPETCREPLKTINERAQKLKSLIDDLLQFTRLDNGTLQMNRTTFSVLGYVHNIVRTNWEIHKLPSSSLRVNGDDFEVHADPERLRQIIDNLIENAIKYSDAVLDVTVSLRADDRNGYVSVSDKGVGISPEHLPFVFDKFYQVEHLDTRKHEGVGLGLALAKELARLMNGTLSVESEVGKGSTFTLTLPLAGSSSRRTDDEGKDEGREKAGFDQDSTPAEVVRSIASSLRELGSEGSNVSRETDQKKGD